MTPEETMQTRVRIATATAAAAVTVAVGLTIASLSGYFAAPGPAPTQEAVTTPAVAVGSAPNVVLVPVQPTSTPSASGQEVLVVSEPPVAEWGGSEARGEREGDERWGAARERDDDGDDDRRAWRGAHEEHDDDD